jgi:hypothetical protein
MNGQRAAETARTITSTLSRFSSCRTRLSNASAMSCCEIAGTSRPPIDEVDQFIALYGLCPTIGEGDERARGDQSLHDLLVTLIGIVARKFGGCAARTGVLRRHSYSSSVDARAPEELKPDLVGEL